MCHVIAHYPVTTHHSVSVNMTDQCCLVDIFIHKQCVYNGLKLLNTIGIDAVAVIFDAKQNNRNRRYLSR